MLTGMKNPRGRCDDDVRFDGSRSLRGTESNVTDGNHRSPSQEVDDERKGVEQEIVACYTSYQISKSKR